MGCAGGYERRLAKVNNPTARTQTGQKHLRSVVSGLAALGTTTEWQIPLSPVTKVSVREMRILVRVLALLCMRYPRARRWNPGFCGYADCSTACESQFHAL